MSRIALITGISGQDGSYLAEMLLKKNYEVHGIVMRSELEAPEGRLWRLSGILDQLTLHPASIESYPSLLKIAQKVIPDECYHLAATSYVSYAFEDEFSIFNSNVNGTHYILSVLKEAAPHCRFYFAGSSEMFGKAKVAPQDEETPFHPRSAYGITKVTGYHLTCNYRDNYNMFACNGILYNHESPRRGNEFVTRKITNSAAQIKLGLAKELILGNVDSERDWGFAGDYVDAMWRMLQQDVPGDFVIATGKLHSVRDLCEAAFGYLDLDYNDYLIVDERFFRPKEEVPLVGDASLARKVLHWQPSVSFEQLIRMMVDEDMWFLQHKSRFAGETKNI
ncbi:MAG: GDP-mannose 4,6-dehydratase [Anaerolineaceae bacterium]|nr:GDP-mannose 4,6-dehydratase [Anaerolineaceae bacterium]